MGANVKAIRTRIRSVESTMHITKAMELVAASKIRRATQRMDQSRFFFRVMSEAFSDMAEGALHSVYAKARDEHLRCYVVIAGDRGLAGGYNNNVFKAVALDSGEKRYCVLPIGKKAVEYYSRHGMDLVHDGFRSVEDFTMEDCAKAGRLLAEGFLAGQFDRVTLVYTSFISMISQNPVAMPLLPLQQQSGAGKSRTAETLYEPDMETVLNAVVPEYLSGMLSGAVAESFASELAARRMAMDAASKNAGEMIDRLSLAYNQARQGAITQEITEIIAGSEG